MTNFEKIKNMTTEDFAKFLDSIMPCLECPILGKCDNYNCQKHLREWLDSELE